MVREVRDPQRKDSHEQDVQQHVLGLHLQPHRDLFRYPPLHDRAVESYILLRHLQPEDHVQNDDAAVHGRADSNQVSITLANRSFNLGAQSNCYTGPMMINFEVS